LAYKYNVKTAVVIVEDFAKCHVMFAKYFLLLLRQITGPVGFMHDGVS
jgi:hypothetical protein